MTNSRILEIIEDKNITISELEDLGFTDRQYIKSDSRPSNQLLGKVTYHNKTYYENYTLTIDNEKGSVVKNNLSLEQTKRFNKLRDEELKLEALKNQLHTYRFEFNDDATAKEIEKKIPIQEAKIKAVEISVNLDKTKKR